MPTGAHGIDHPDMAGLLAADDEQLAAALQDADLPSLLPAIAYLTGDTEWIEQPGLRPRVSLDGAILAPQGGMSEEEQEEARRVALAGLRKLRAAGAPAPLGDDRAHVRRLMQFITGEVDDDYEPLLQRELGLLDNPETREIDSLHRPAARPAPPLLDDEAFFVVVIGAGMSGLVTAYRLEQAGIPFTVIERNSDVGGVWFENGYPGCRLDTSNFAYSYSFAQKNDWRHQYSARDDIHGYFREVAGRLALRGRRIEFDTEVVAAEYDDDRCVWWVTTQARCGERRVRRANAVISAVGQLNQPSIPDYPGTDEFEGTTFHTARWDHSVDLHGKRVAVIGTGASGYQVIPSIAEAVDKLYVFQRSAPWALPAPAYHDEVQPGLRWLFSNVPYYHRWYRFYQFWTAVEGMRRFAIVDPNWQRKDSVSEANHRLRLELEGYLRAQYADRPDLVEKVVPHYPPYAKRMLRDNGVWAATLKSPNVSLVTDSISAITHNGIRTEGGTEHEVDVIIYATGFKASHFLPTIAVKGRDGIDLHDQWSEDPRAYLGITVPGFPNFFCIFGPNTNLVLSGSIILFSELAVDYVVRCLDMLAAHGNGAMECRQDPFEAYNNLVDAGNEAMAWGLKDVRNWYKSASGRVSQTWPFSTFEYWRVTQGPEEEDFAFSKPSSKVGDPADGRKR
jgi:4-hydroxyacetophenone monooxygenase